MLAGLRLALVGPTPPPSGGMANQTQQLARLLRSEGAQVELVPVNAPYRPAWVSRLRGVRAAFRLLSYLPLLWRAAGRNDLMHVMASSGWSWHLFAAPAVWIAWMRKVPVIVNYRGGEAESFFQRAFRWVRPTLARASSVMVPSGFLAEVFARQQVETVVVPNVIDLESFRPAPEASFEGRRLIVTRNLEPVYDVATAIRAFEIVAASFPDSRLIVAGDGPERPKLESLVTQRGLHERVRFTGNLPNEQVADLYQTAALMLNSSLADNMPISILEAAASGVAVVSTDVGGVPYLVRDGESALLVPPGDPAALAQAAIRLLSDRELYLSLREAGRRTAVACGWPRVRERLAEVYVQTARGPARHTYRKTDAA